MVSPFVLRRSQAARRQAPRDGETSVEAIATLVALATSLADRMDAMPSAGLDRDHERRERVDVLRRTAEAGRRTIDARIRSGAADQVGQHLLGG